MKIPWMQHRKDFLKTARYIILMMPIIPLAWLILEKPFARGYSLVAIMVNLSAVIWLFPKWQLSQYKFKKDQFKYAELENSYRKTISQLIGGMLLLSGLYATLHTINLSQESLQLSRDTQIGDRFSRAIQNLSMRNANGDISMELRISSILSLEQIAKENEQYFLQVTQLLSTYIRENAHWDDSHPSIAPRELRADIQLVLFVLTRLSHLGYKYAVAYDIPESDLRKAFLAGHNINHGNLSYSNLGGSNLNKTQFVYSNLSHVNFESAHLDTDFTYGNLNDANFTGAYLSGTSFSVTFMEGVNFTDATFDQVKFIHCDLTKVVGLTCKQLSSSRICETSLPEYVQNCGIENSICK